MNGFFRSSIPPKCTNSCTSLYAALLDDVENLLPSYNSNTFDRYTILNGIVTNSIHLKVLPTLGKAFESCLITGERFILPPDYAGEVMFKLPRLLYQLSACLIDPVSGLPHWKLCGTCTSAREKLWAATYFRCLRQICFAYSKYRSGSVVISPGDREKVRDRLCIEKFSLDKADHSVLRIARRLLRHATCDASGNLLPLLKEYRDTPWGRHGPGAVEDGSTGGYKWDFCIPLGMRQTLFKYRANLPNFPVRKDTGASRLTAVPKDFRGPRYICIEPKEKQFAQQGLMHTLYKLVQSNPVTMYEIDFQDQLVSQELCCSPNCATIDLKDASDLVSLKLVKYLFDKRLYKLFSEYRTPFIHLDGADTKACNVLKCFASMGSALCFPVETLVFWAISSAASYLQLGRAGRVRCFGDDIIVERNAAPRVLSALSSCGLVINKTKTCVDTPIRESCGAYWFYGYDVVVTNIKTDQFKSVDTWQACVKYAQQLERNCFFRASKAMASLGDKFFPIDDSFLFYSRGVKCNHRWNRDLHRSELLLPCNAKYRMRDAVFNYERLYCAYNGNPTSTVSGRHSNKVKYRWVAK